MVAFKNHGASAGTSLRHPHWQVIATPVVPRLLRQKHAVATDYFDQTGHCLYCVTLQRELAAKRRVLAVNDDFAAFFAGLREGGFDGHVAYEMCSPLRGEGSEANLDAAAAKSLAVTRRLIQ